MQLVRRRGFAFDFCQGKAMLWAKVRNLAICYILTHEHCLPILAYVSSMAEHKYMEWTLPHQCLVLSKTRHPKLGDSGTSPYTHWSKSVFWQDLLDTLTQNHLKGGSLLIHVNVEKIDCELKALYVKVSTILLHQYVIFRGQWTFITLCLSIRLSDVGRRWCIWNKEGLSIYQWWPSAC